MATTDTARSAEWEPKHALRRNLLARSAENQEAVKDLLARHSGDDAQEAEKRVDAEVTDEASPPAA